MNAPNALLALLKMSDKREAQDKLLIILRNAEDYPTWKPYTVSRLQQQNCHWAVTGRPQPNLESVWATLIEDGFAPADLRPATLVAALRDEKKDHPVALTKSAGLIKELVDKSLHPLLNNKTAAEMWTVLENRFQHISPMRVRRIFSDACNVKLLECKDNRHYWLYKPVPNRFWQNPQFSQRGLVDVQEDYWNDLARQPPPTSRKRLFSPCIGNWDCVEGRNDPV